MNSSDERELLSSEGAEYSERLRQEVLRARDKLFRKTAMSNNVLAQA